MPFNRMIYDINDIKGRGPKGFELRFQRFLLNVFGETAAKAIYCAIINIIAFIMKIGVFLSLPFKFVQFFILALREQSSRSSGKD